MEFWDPQAQRVSFGVAGPATAPTVSVDWDSALRGVAERELENRLRGLLEKKRRAGVTEPATDAPTLPAPPTQAQSDVTPPVSREVDR